MKLLEEKEETEAPSDSEADSKFPLHMDPFGENIIE